MLAETTRLSSHAIQQLTISASRITQSCRNAQQVTPNAFSPNTEYPYQPAVKFCRLCLWHDSISQGSEFLRTEWMLCVPNICPICAVPMEDDCDHYHSQRFLSLYEDQTGISPGVH